MDKEMLEKCLESSLKMSQQMKVHFSRLASGKEDIRPFVVIGMELKNDDDETIVGGCVAPVIFKGKEHPVDALPHTLNKLHEEGLEKFNWLCFITEGYVRSAENATEASELEKLLDAERGAMEKEFNEKPDTNVREGIIASLFSWENQSLVMTSLYKWGDDGLPIFDEIDNKAGITPTPEMSGRVPFVFNAFIKYCQMCEELKNQNEENKKNPIFFGEEKYDFSKKPSFSELWSFLNSDDDNRVSKKIAKKVSNFNMRVFTLRVAKECWAGIQEQIDKGELDEQEFTANVGKIMSGDDEQAKMDLIGQLVTKYSLLGNAMAHHLGQKEMPNDISELLG